MSRPTRFFTRSRATRCGSWSPIAPARRILRRRSMRATISSRLAWSNTLTARWERSIMSSWARLTNQNGNGTHGAFSTGIVMDRDLCKGFGAFGQVFDISSDEPGATHSLSAGFGGTWKATSDLQLDFDTL